MVRVSRLPVLCAVLAACSVRPPVPGLEPVPVPDDVTVAERVETYPVVGGDRATIGAALHGTITDANGKHFAGLHSWHLTWNYQTHGEFAQCTIVRVTVTLTSTVTLPVWTHPSGVDSGLVLQWEQYLRALAVHERGHRAIAYAGAGRVIRAIRGVSDQSCAVIRNAVRAAVEPLVAAIRAEEAQYDLETRHGATQGATWLQ